MISKVFYGIAAMDKGNHLIGVDGTLPSYFPKEDLAYFKKKTEGQICVMGRDTFLSLPDHELSLPNRTLFVLSSTLEPRAYSAYIYPSLARILPQLLTHALRTKKQVWVIGGAAIYSQLFTHIKEFHLTHVTPPKETNKITSRHTAHFPWEDFNKHFDTKQYTPHPLTPETEVRVYKERKIPSDQIPVARGYGKHDDMVFILDDLVKNKP